MTVSFTTTREEAATIHKIVALAVKGTRLSARERVAIEMDITATHANGCPLDLDGLLAAGQSKDGAFHFFHDINGIIANIDRSTGRLTGGFMPRFSTPDAWQES